MSEKLDWLNQFLVSPPNTDACIVWPFGKSNGSNYPKVKIKGKPYTVTRLVLLALVGSPPKSNYQATHKPIICHNRYCINPNHLEWKTPSQNQQDRLLDGTTMRYKPAFQVTRSTLNAHCQAISHR